MKPEVDESSWPVIKVTYPETMTLDEIREGAELLRRIATTRGPMVTVSDISAINVMAATAVHRKLFAQEADRLVAMGAFIAEATIIRNPLVRVLHIGHSWLRTRKNHPLGTFADWPAALAWARTCVVRHGKPRAHDSAL